MGLACQNWHLVQTMFQVVQLTQKISLVHFSLVPGALSAALLPIFVWLLSALDHRADVKINGSNMCAVGHGKTGRDLERSRCREKRWSADLHRISNCAQTQLACECSFPIATVQDRLQHCHMAVENEIFYRFGSSTVRAREQLPDDDVPQNFWNPQMRPRHAKEQHWKANWICL